MTVLRFTENDIKPAVAHKIIHRDKTHFNIKHGSRTKNGWQYRMSVDDEIVDMSTDIYTLEGDSYCLIPAFKNQEQIKDGARNKVYFISTTEREDLKSHSLLFVNLPNYKSYSQTIAGDVEVIAKGIDLVRGKQLDAPVFYFTGIGKVEFKLETIDGRNQTIIFRSKPDGKIVFTIGIK